MGDGRACGRACQFIQPDYETVEARVHGRPADPALGEEAFFGVAQTMIRARLTPPAPGAQWTGITTALAASLLERGLVDAVLAVRPHPEDKWRPEPVIVIDPAALAECRGMRMGYAPTLAALDRRRPQATGASRVIPASLRQVYALRMIEAELGLARILRHRHALFRQHHGREFPPVPRRCWTTAPIPFPTSSSAADYRVELRYDDGRPTKTVRS